MIGTAIEERLVSTASGPLNVVSHGDGPPLLLIPGLGGRAAFWFPLMQHAGGARRLISFDHPGCGKSPAGSAACSTVGLVERVISLLDALELSCVGVIGHSMGGAIGQHLAATQPTRVARLVLSATWAGPDTWFDDLFATRLAILDQAGSDAYLAHGQSLALPGWWAQANFTQTTATLASRQAAFPGMAEERARIAAVRQHDARASLSRIAAPTLIVCAADDAITPPAFSEELARSIADARLSLLPTGGHFAPITMTPDYWALIEPFMQQPMPHRADLEAVAP